ncbi:MAG: 2Fe-2S iron-sulfur cluster-binding protein [Anderseniella sp.]
MAAPDAHVTGLVPKTMTATKHHKITVANRGGRELYVRDGQNIADVCEAADIPVPIACRYGGCITCAGKLVSGSVRQPKGTALNKRQSQAGYILMCVAQPKEDCIIEVGVETHGQLYRNPFLGPE